MRELEYPFDAEYIVSKKRKLKKELLASGTKFMQKNIAILGGSTTNDVMLILELFLLNYGIQAEFYESEYGRFYEDAMFSNPELEGFCPDLIYIHTTNQNILSKSEFLEGGKKDIDGLLEQEYRRFETMWDRLNETYHCPVIQNNFEYPYYRLLGNKDASDIHGMVNYITRLNLRFYGYAQTHDNFYINDINYLSADYGLSKWSDPFYWHMYKYALSVPAIPYLCFNIANIVKSVFGMNKKGFVLDLDNTLWGGVIGDVGVEHIELGPEEPNGQVYAEMQWYIKQHKKLGILLNIDSKNDYGNAVLGLRHPDSAFTVDDFISIKANWEPKDKNFGEIAKELNLLPESLVFVDDNPAEREIIRMQYPGAAVPEIDSPEHYIQILDRSGYFEMTNFSEDDRKRNTMYQENAKRSQLQKTFEHYEDYLYSLKMKATIRPFEALYIARIAQLTNKSNQFNLTTRRYTQTEIEEIAADTGHYITLYGRLEDKFGDNGVVSVVIGRLVEEELQIVLWLMSCRVLKRDMEYAMMDVLVSNARNKGVTKIRGYYYPTSKNKMAAEFYALQGFQKVFGDETGNTEWILDLSQDYILKNKVIKVEG